MPAWRWPPVTPKLGRREGSRARPSHRPRLRTDNPARTPPERVPCSTFRNRCREGCMDVSPAITRAGLTTSFAVKPTRRSKRPHPCRVDGVGVAPNAANPMAATTSAPDGPVVTSRAPDSTAVASRDHERRDRRSGRPPARRGHAGATAPRRRASPRDRPPCEEATASPLVSGCLRRRPDLRPPPAPCGRRARVR